MANRVCVALGAGLFGVIALLLALCPRIAWAFFSLGANRYLGSEFKPHVERGDMMLAWVGLMLAPLVLYEAWRASEQWEEFGPLDFHCLVPGPLVGGFVLSLLAPIWGAALPVAYSGVGGIAAVVWYELGTLSVTAFVVAAGSAVAETKGNKPGKLFLSVLFHTAGCFGVWYARRLFPESKTLEEVTEKPPAGIAFLVVLAVLAVLTGQL
jgi:hypothetical protein